MMNGTMGAWGLGRFVVALGTLSLGLLVTGCQPECVDRYSCAIKGAPGEGKQYACVDGRCVPQDVPGATDAGTDAGTEPTDAGTDACANVPHDPKLGTLQLQTGFAAAETATLPEGIGAVTAVPSGSAFKLYGLRNTDIHALGTWPNVALGAAPLQSIYAEADRDGGTRFPNGYLTNDGTRLLAGYTKPGPLTNTPGTVLVYDTATPANSTYLSANGNFSAAGYSGGFFINGQGIEGASEGGNGIYGLKTSATPFQGSKVANFPTAELFSSATAVASNGVAVFGYSSYPTDTLRAVAPATYNPEISSGAPFVLNDTNAPEVYSGTDLKSATGFGAGVALHRGTFTATSDISRFELTLGGSTPTSVTVGERKSVLTVSNTCSDVVLMAPMGPDLLVGVKDKNGRRLVRLQVQP
jgi:hypothetical protein